MSIGWLMIDLSQVFGKDAFISPQSQIDGCENKAFR
jgi:hypothetical protein